MNFCAQYRNTLHKKSTITQITIEKLTFQMQKIQHIRLDFVINIQYLNHKMISYRSFVTVNCINPAFVAKTNQLDLLISLSLSDFIQ